MIMQATKTIEEAFKAQNWSYKVDEHPDGKSSAVITGFDLKCGANVQIFFISAAGPLNFSPSPPVRSTPPFTCATK